MRNYIILWIILGLGVFLILQNVPTDILGQVFVFLIALTIVWALCSFLHGTLTIFYPKMAQESWGIQILGEIANFNRANKTTQEPIVTQHEHKDHPTYMTQNEVLNLVDTAFKTFSNKNHGPLSSLVAEEVNKQLQYRPPVQSVLKEKLEQPRENVTTTSTANPAYADLVKKYLEQREMIFQLEKNVEAANKDHQKWREKLVEQLQQKNAQLLILKNQEEAIQELKTKIATLEPQIQRPKTSRKAEKVRVDFSPVDKKIEQIKLDSKVAMDALFQKLNHLEQQQQQAENIKAPSPKTSPANLAPVYEHINKQNEAQKRVIDGLYHKMLTLENHQKQIELFPTEQSSAPDFSPIYNKMKVVSAEQREAMDVLYQKIVAVENRQNILENQTNTNDNSTLDLSPIHQKIQELSDQQAADTKKWQQHIKKLTKTHQETLKQQKTTTAAQPRYEQMFKNFDEILAHQEGVLEELKEKMLSEADLQTALSNYDSTEGLSKEEVNELIEAALSDGSASQRENYVTRDQFQDGLMDLAERVEEQLRSRA